MIADGDMIVRNTVSPGKLISPSLHTSF